MNLSLAQIAYVGDDIVDLPAMRAVGCPITVADAMPENQACALYVTRLTGGQGCVMEICDILVAQITSHKELGEWGMGNG